MDGFKELDQDFEKLQKIAFRRLWWMIPLALSVLCGFLVLIAVLIKWVLGS